MVERLLGRGIYDSAEVSSLLGVHPETLARWAVGHAGRLAIVPPSAEGRIFTFPDLVSLLAVAELWRRGVHTDEIRLGVELLAKELGTDRPLARREVYEQLATVGRSFFAKLDEWFDIGKGGQGSFHEVVAPLLKRLEFDAQGIATVWRPRERVWLNPKVQAGAPCLDGTRVPTSMIAQLAARGEDLADIADEYEVDLDAVRSAMSFEESLKPAA